MVRTRDVLTNREIVFDISHHHENVRVLYPHVLSTVVEYSKSTIH